jgi:hypothetical protein
VTTEGVDQHDPLAHQEITGLVQHQRGLLILRPYFVASCCTFGFDWGAYSARGTVRARICMEGAVAVA